MFTPFTRQRAMATGLTCLLFVSLALAACGGAAAPVSEEPVSSDETEEVAQPPAAENEEQAQENQEAASAEEEVTAAEETEATSEEPTPEESEAVAKEPGAEESVTEEAEVGDNENLLAPDQELASIGDPAECRAVTPDNDPIAAALQPNELIALVSDSDWSKGPADAPITLIEYGDFQ